MERARESSRAWRWYLPCLLVATAAFKAALAWTHPGFLSGDDFEIVAAAARYAAGFDYTAWAIRSMFHPLLAWPFVRAGVLAGLSSPRWLTFLATLPTVAFSTLAILALYRLALRLGFSEPAARGAAFLYAAHPLALTYGAAPFPRPISTCLLLWAFLLAGAETGTGRPATAGLLAAAATAVRWSEGLMLAPLVGFGLWRTGRARTVLAILAGFSVGFVVLVGLLDAATWGRPFASFAAFLRFGRDPLLGGFRSRPWFWYAAMLLQWAGPLLLALAAFAWPDRRSRAPLAAALSAVVLFSLSPLKQMRYMQAALPFLALAAALGWEALRRATGARRLAAAAVVPLALVFGLERTRHVFGRKSQAAIDVASALAALPERPRSVVLEQAWAYGQNLYLGGAVAIRDLPPSRPLDSGVLDRAAASADAVALYREDVDAAGAAALAREGFRSCGALQRGWSAAVVLYRPAPRPCPDLVGSPADASAARPGS